MTAAIDSPGLAAMFPMPVQAAELRGAGDPAQLLPSEREGKERWAEKRVREFAAGRACARLALQRLGYPPMPLLSLPDRRADWPVGVTGSITHCAGLACAVVAPVRLVKSLGLDVEVMDAVDEHLWPRVLNARERVWLQSCPAGEQRLWATVIFSAKEAFYKCQYPVTARWLEFEEAQVEVQRPERPSKAFAIRVTSHALTLSGQGVVSEGHVRTAISWPCDTLVPDSQAS
jgi:4'-phosphopantetheinyl transferase EntD